MSIQDSPLLIAFLGFVVCLGTFVAWIKSGRKELLYLLAALVLIFVGLLVYERVTISDQEAIKATLYDLAHKLETNDREGIYRGIHPSATDIRGKAQGELPNYTFEECRITQFHKVEVTPGSSPKTATVEFNVLAKGSFRYQGDVIPGSVPRWVQLQMEQDVDGQWKVTAYDHDEPNAYMRTPKAP